MARTVRAGCARCSPSWPARRHRLRRARRARAAGRQADRRAPGDVLGLLAARGRGRRARRCRCWPPRARPSSTGPTDLTIDEPAVRRRAARAARRAPVGACAELPRRPAPGTTCHGHWRTWSRSTGRTPTWSCSTSGSRCSSGRSRAPSTAARSTPPRGRAAWRPPASAGIDARPGRAHDLDALVTPSYAPASPIDLVNAESHPGRCTAADARWPATPCSRSRPSWRPACRWRCRSGAPRAARPRWWRSPHGYEAARDRIDRPAPAADVPAVRLSRVSAPGFSPAPICGNRSHSLPADGSRSRRRIRVLGWPARVHGFGHHPLLKAAPSDLEFGGIDVGQLSGGDAVPGP